MGGRRRALYAVRARSPRQCAQPVDGFGQRIDHPPEPRPRRIDLADIGLNERLAAHAYAVEIAERHRERPPVAKPYNLGRDIDRARTTNRKSSSDCERIDCACYFYEQALDACDPAVTPESRRSRYGRHKSAHE
jgi:hypothetical protein